MLTPPVVSKTDPYPLTLASMAQPTDAGQWMNVSALAAATGLTPAQITQFIPATPSAAGPLYNPHQAAVAAVVRNLIDAGVPDTAIHAAVADLNTRPYSHVHNLASASRTPPRRTRGLWIAAAAAAAIVIALTAGLIGNAIGASGADHNPLPVAAPETITITETLQPPTIGAPADPVCQQWAPMADDYRAKLKEWVAIDPGIPASKWSVDQRAVNMRIIPVLREEVAELRRLAEQSHDELLSALLRSQAAYQEEYAQRIPAYEPGDQRLWQAVTDFGNAVNSLCSAAPK